QYITYATPLLANMATMFLRSHLSLLALYSISTSASVTVRKTDKGPTGYEVDFKYTNSTAQRVLIGGGLQAFSDQFHTTLDSRAWYDPHDYKPGDFYVSYGRPEEGYEWPYEMAKESGNDDGLWTYTTPLPSGIYSFAYLVNCDFPPNCTIDTGQLVT